jgi:hypothetical protein
MNTEKPVREPLPRGFWVIWSTVALDMVGLESLRQFLVVTPTDMVRMVFK